MGFGPPQVEQNKQALVRGLINNGIKLFAFAPWDQQGQTEAPQYNAESEEQAANIISNRVSTGKVAVLGGAEHMKYDELMLKTRFPHTADNLKRIGKNVKSYIFVGGVSLPMAYDRHPDQYIKRAAERNGRDQETFVMNLEAPIHNLNADGLIHLPHKPFIPPNQP